MKILLMTTNHPITIFYNLLITYTTLACAVKNIMGCVIVQFDLDKLLGWAEMWHILIIKNVRFSMWVILIIITIMKFMRNGLSIGIKKNIWVCLSAEQ